MPKIKIILLKSIWVLTFFFDSLIFLNIALPEVYYNSNFRFIPLGKMQLRINQIAELHHD